MSFLDAPGAGVGVTLALLSVACHGGPAPAVAPRAACDGLAVIRFAEHLCPRLASAEKRITLRSRHRTEIRAGQVVQLVCMERGRRFVARVTGVRHTTWAGITTAELSDDGLDDHEQMMRVMQRYYPGARLSDPATVYRFEGAAPCAR